MSEPITHKQMDDLLSTRDKELKKHLVEQFDHMAEIDTLKHDRIAELMELHNDNMIEMKADLKENKESIVRVHSRVDKIDTKIKTVQGIGGVLGSAITIVLGWVGFIK